MRELMHKLVPALTQEWVQELVHALVPELMQVEGPETGTTDSLLDHGPSGPQQVVETDPKVLLPCVQGMLGPRN